MANYKLCQKKKRKEIKTYENDRKNYFLFFYTNIYIYIFSYFVWYRREWPFPVDFFFLFFMIANISIFFVMVRDIWVFSVNRLPSWQNKRSLTLEGVFWLVGSFRIPLFTYFFSFLFFFSFFFKSDVIKFSFMYKIVQICWLKVVTTNSFRDVTSWRSNGNDH